MLNCRESMTGSLAGIAILLRHIAETLRERACETIPSKVPRTETSYTLIDLDCPVVTRSGPFFLRTCMDKLRK